MVGGKALGSWYLLVITLAVGRMNTTGSGSCNTSVTSAYITNGLSYSEIQIISTSTDGDVMMMKASTIDMTTFPPSGGGSNKEITRIFALYWTLSWRYDDPIPLLVMELHYDLMT